MDHDSDDQECENQLPIHHTMLFTDNDLCIHLDLSRSFLSSKPDHESRVSLFAKYILRKYSRPMLFVTVIGIAYFYALVAVPDPDHVGPFLVIASLVLMGNFFFFSLLNPAVVLMACKHFESLFLLSNIVVGITTFADLIGWNVYTVSVVIFYITSFSLVVFVDAWPVSFERSHTRFMDIIKSFHVHQQYEERPSPNDGPPRVGIQISEVDESLESTKHHMQSRPNTDQNTLQVHGSNIYTDIAQPSNQDSSAHNVHAGTHESPASHVYAMRHSARSLTSMGQSQTASNLHVSAIERLNRHSISFSSRRVNNLPLSLSNCMRFYRIMTQQVTLSSNTIFVRLRLLYMYSTIHGKRAIIAHLFAILTPIYISMILDLDERVAANMRTFTILESTITTEFLFRTCCANITLVFLQRLVRMIIAPMKIHCISRKMLKIPLVEAWNHIIQEETYQKLKRMCFSNGFTVGESERRFRQSMIITPDSAQKLGLPASAVDRIPARIAEHPASERSSSSSRLHPFRSDSESGRDGHISSATQEQAGMPRLSNYFKRLSSNTALGTTPNRQNSQYIRVNPVLSRSGLILTPGKCIHLTPSQESLFHLLLPTSISSRIDPFAQGSIRLAEWALLLSPILAFIHISTSDRLLHFGICIAYIPLLLLGILHIGAFSYPAMLLAAHTFESVFASAAMLVLCLILGDYAATFHQDRIPAILILFLAGVKMILVDAQPNTHKGLHNRLMSFFHTVQNGEPYDVDLLIAITSLARIIRKKLLATNLNHVSMTGEQFQNQAWSDPELTDLILDNPVSSASKSYIKSQARMVLFFARNAFAVIFVGAVYLFILWGLVDGNMITDHTDRMVNTPFGQWSSKTALRACLFNLVVIQLRRMWSLIRFPVRCVCYERRVVKFPLVAAIDHQL
eukprot:TRINITY_DN11943_c0_g1_i1.p1 TRINITY_DN11943_c0_g1~~TRINITY_DN11943_c0_g1_i1.p1  ORF type:complete len:910 (+),score=148.69 TRINITY_DN11943_c0_g1_i1:103-2832(+)